MFIRVQVSILFRDQLASQGGITRPPCRNRPEKPACLTLRNLAARSVDNMLLDSMHSLCSTAQQSQKGQLLVGQRTSGSLASSLNFNLLMRAFLYLIREHSC